MAAKKSSSSSKATDTLSQVFSQAKQSLEFLKFFEQEALDRAKKIFGKTNKEIKNQIQKMGFVTQEEFDELKERVEALEKCCSNCPSCSGGSDKSSEE